MADTHFTGPVWSANGFFVGDGSVAAAGTIGGVGTAAAPYSMGTTANQKLFADYATVAATTGDTRLSYNKLTFTGAGGSGETLRAFSVVTGVGAAVGGTINGAHVSTEIDSTGTISGAANALRATIGGTATTPGGTLAALQVDSNFAAGVTVPAVTSFIRVTDTNTTTVPNLLNLPAPANGSIYATHTTQVMTHSIRIIAGGTNYYMMCTTAATNRG